MLNIKNLFSKIFGGRGRKMITYDVWVNSRETCFHYREFESVRDIEAFLIDLKEDKTDLEDYIFYNLDACGLEFEETYFISVKNGEQKIDFFDPTKDVIASKISRGSVEEIPDNRNRSKSCRGYLYFIQMLKAQYTGQLVLEDPYQREKMTIDLDIHKIYRANEDESNPDVFEFASLNYSGDSIELEVSPVDGMRLNKFVIFDDNGEKVELDTDHDVDEIIHQLKPYLN